MIIEFQLEGSKTGHAGIFDTTGFWVKYGEEICDKTLEITSYKLWSHFSFTFEHDELSKVMAVWEALIKLLKTTSPNKRVDIEGVGYFQSIG